jgi:hypothetical protein
MFLFFARRPVAEPEDEPVPGKLVEAHS